MFIAQGTAARPAPRPAELIIRRLSALAELSEAELREVRFAASTSETVRAGRDLHPDRGRHARFVVSGWACRRRLLTDGRRQIFSFVLPGDVVADADGRVEASALTPVEAVDAEHLRRAAEHHPGLAQAFAAMADQQQRLLLDQVVRLGRMSALERLAHLLLELRERLAAVGLADEQRLPLPLTQEVMADALGLSIVHVNRTLQQLRQDGLLELRSGVATLPDPARLADLCGHLRSSAPRFSPPSSPGVDAPGPAPFG